MLEVTWLLLNGCNFEKSKSTNLDDRTIFVEQDPPRTGDLYPKSCPSDPRLIHTHLRQDLLEATITEGQAKVIAVMRNPKDVLVSQYHFYQMNTRLGPFTGTWDEFFEMFKNKELHCGYWWDHVKSWWQQKDNSNYHFVKYEEMKKDPRGTISKLAGFLGVAHSEDELDRVLEHIQFDKMGKNKMVNRESWDILDQTNSRFMRKGVIGDWINYFNTEQSEFVDGICKELVEGGLHFEFE